MKTWFCVRCKSENSKTVEKIFKNGVTHLEKRCENCDTWNGYAPKTEASDWVFPFGQYKNKTVREVFEIDPRYLEWVRENLTGRAKNVANEFLVKIGSSK